MITFYYKIDGGEIETITVQASELVSDGLADLLVENGRIEGYSFGPNGANPDIEIIRITVQ